MSWTLCLVLAAAAMSADEAALIDAVLQAHPEIEASEHRASSMERMAEAMGSWWDPMVGLEYSNMPLSNPVLGSHPMAGLQLKVTQKLPFPGKLEARSSAMKTAAQAEQHTADEARNMLIAQTRMRIVMLRQARGLLVVTQEQRASLSRLREAVRIRYELGKADQHDVLRLEVLDGKLAEKELDLQEMANTAARELNAMAARETSTVLGLGSNNELVEIPLSELGRPMLKVLEGRAEAARARASAAAKDGLPDFTTWLGYRVRLASGADPGDNFVTLGVSMPLPWLWGRARWDSTRLAEEQMAAGIDASRRALARQLQTRVEGARVRHARATARARSHETNLIPKAKETLVAALNAYQVDRATFADLFQAELDVIELERVAVNARAEAALAAVEVDTETGRALTQEKP